MKFLKYFKRNAKDNTALTAKERLQIIISHERVKRQHSDVLENLQRELLQVISKYFHIDPDNLNELVKVDVERDGDHSVLELNITLPDVEITETIAS